MRSSVTFHQNLFGHRGSVVRREAHYGRHPLYTEAGLQRHSLHALDQHTQHLGKHHQLNSIMQQVILDVYL